MNGPLDATLRRRQLEQFTAQLAERRRRQAKLEHRTRGYRDEDGVWRCGLLSFTRYFWHVLEPGKEMVEGWVLEAICEHLEAVTYGEIKRLLITVPPGCSKSLLTDVFWPAWQWATGRARNRFVAFSYSSGLTERDNGRFRDLIMHPEFQAMYADQFVLRKVGETRITNDKHGWKLATSVGGIGTGERGDIIILDDPHNVKEGESDQIRTETVRWFREAMSDRLNDMRKGAIVIIMQRVHEEDVAGAILSNEFDYVHLSIPMEFVWTADENGEPYATEIGWVDPRWTEDPEECDGDLMWPERFPPEVVASIRKEKGPYAYAAQYQQTPEARGGGIFKRDFWRHWEGKFPAFDYVFGSLDGAFTEDEGNDPSALTIWGVWRHESGFNRAMLIFGWRKFLDFEGTRLKPEPGENQREFMARQMEEWGLVEWTAETCKHWKVDRLLIENKASGKAAATSLRKRYVNRNWSIQLVEPKGDKVARAIAVQPTFSNGMVYAPTDRQWCRDVIDEMAVFPYGKHDDYTDSVTQAVKHLRDQGLLELDEDVRAEEIRGARLEIINQKSKLGKISNYLPGATG
jgi:predicted phage terminase large subunit-like protein